MELAARTGVWHGGASLPYLRTVKFLKSDGGQFIDLPFGFDPTDEVDTEFSIDSGIYDTFMVSPIVWNDDNNRFSLGVQGGEFVIGFGNRTTSTFVLQPRSLDGMIHKWHYADRLCVMYYDETTILSVDTATTGTTFGRTTANLRLFYGYNTNQRVTIKYYKHSKNGAVVIDLIPVLDLAGLPAMYDKVSGQLFYNQGTGEFTWEENDAASSASASNGGGYKCLTPRRSYRRSSRPSARFYARTSAWEVAA